MTNIVKFGGSVITEKGGAARIRTAALKRLAAEAARVPGPLIVVHGAGSFGHPHAKRHAIADGLTTENVGAFAALQHDVRALHEAVCGALLDAGLAPASLPPFAVARNRDGHLARLDVKAFDDALHRGLVPVTCGDGVLDEARGFSIVSGDDLMARLARRLDGVARAVFATDVDGLYTAPPGTKDATLLRDIGVSDLGRVVAAGSRATDVTGGMAKKMSVARAVASAGVETLIVNGARKGRVAAALAGDDVVGTRVAPWRSSR